MEIRTFDHTRRGTFRKGWILSFCLVLVLFHPNSSMGQSASPNFIGRTEVKITLDRAAELASQLESELIRKFSLVVGWQCQDAERWARSAMTPARAVPGFNLTCVKGPHELTLRLIIDESTARNKCGAIKHTKTKIENGKQRADFHSFFETSGWKVMQHSKWLDGCAFGALSLDAYWPDRESADAAGVELVEEFAHALMSLDLSDLTSSEIYLEHKATLRDLMGALATQTAALEAMLPGITLQEAPLIKNYDRQKRQQERSGLPVSEPPVEIRELYSEAQNGWYHIIGRAPQKPQQGPSMGSRLLAQAVGPPSTLHQLSEAPWVVAALNHYSECSIIIAFSSGTGKPVARYGGVMFKSVLDEEAGQDPSEFTTKETERFVARKSPDGKRMEAVFNERIYLDLQVKKCEDAHDPIDEVFNHIAGHDLSQFGID